MGGYLLAVAPAAVITMAALRALNSTPRQRSDADSNDVEVALPSAWERFRAFDRRLGERITRRLAR